MTDRQSHRPATGFLLFLRHTTHTPTTLPRSFISGGKPEQRRLSSPAAQPSHTPHLAELTERDGAEREIGERERER
ncbi:hypothetical protein HanRHA438_Chr09g0412521 [Helianthus annuus]|uniref:Uncharacterized protein n=1 Tax=Helianthus annuus TaxID=4232 RepID=A0A251S182_HELAN|nr:hypothetical protein HanXRQr2_Chr09g0400681 [Helianthus annuus]KAJ0535533.1 hypothetical protein HanIR_Chr09g0431641 [Helianthus annuus]KAJ0889407.1 hypothetical protein HanRHA438_Chr09g0412521 [Helianthus annuus]KAJ0894209.1 hypothetical protein HanPSC8_Chr09g0386461 [Helianthus annuus]